MIDQADKLRRLMKKSKNEKSTEKNKSEKRAKVLAITSGKGGVGKTNFALNFSISLQKLGYEVIIFDADVGLANVEILSGVNLKSSISDIILLNKDINEVIAKGPEGIKMVSGGSGLKELALLNEENMLKMLKEIKKLQSTADFIIIDTGAGISSVVLDFVMASDEVIIVTTPDPTSIMDSYTLIKSLSSYGFKEKLNIITNMVDDKSEGKEVFNKLNNATFNFLRIQLNYLGYIERTNIINNAVRNQIPFIVSNPNSIVSKKLNNMTINYTSNRVIKEDNENKSFAEKLLHIFSRRGER
ncbi:MinD/ParA family protein [Tissierella sp. MSJ-40]|uniref:MinD/ParA family protein n=1 Tax=Tissierella simiarum TaxID=2841534 RepID=A0ABS6E453_9FIRM|nr:MinD/ParA family protein [Tissierella simiarum]MBU5437688.1 MinD/ParA family protein [Tissierella simiarum]